MRAVRWIIAIVIAAGVCWLFPLFHIVTLKTATAEKAAEKFNATAFAENFWTEKLLPAASKAVSADVLLAAIQANPSNAKTNYSRSVGLSDSYFYFVSGTGRMVAFSNDEVLLAVTDGSTNAEISLHMGLIFGNALRDGTGLLNASDYPNSQDFNDISEALNHIAETRVWPKLLEQAKIDIRLGVKQITFVGCVEVDDETTDLKPLKVIPIQTGVQ
jgi:predicted lipoprotein